MKKGVNPSLSETEPNFASILAGRDWQTRASDAVGFDLDATTFLLGENDKVRRNHNRSSWIAIANTPLFTTRDKDTPLSHETKSPVVAAFDFDGTITTRDTFVPFLFHAFGFPTVLRALAPLTGEGVRVLLNRASRDQFKAKLIARLFTDVAVDPVRLRAQSYARSLEPILRPAALERIAWHKAHGHRLVLVSASLDLYLDHVRERLGFDQLICTCLQSEQGRFDGRMAGGNCRGPEKVRRLQARFGNLSLIELHAYGDSDGDREMLACANHAYFKPFHRIKGRR